MRRTLATLALLLGSIAFAGCLDVNVDSSQGAIEGGECQAGKIEICHVPPGNPDNAHTICVGAAAEDAHVAHGDHPGACDGGDEEPPPDDGGDPPNTCSGEGQACNTDADCCDASLWCAGFCYRPS
jgi:hypothetical protein